MKYLRLVFTLEGLDAVLYLGPFSPYWATLWLDTFRQHFEIGGMTAELRRARIVDSVP